MRSFSQGPVLLPLLLLSATLNTPNGDLFHYGFLFGWVRRPRVSNNDIMRIVTASFSIVFTSENVSLCPLDECGRSSEASFTENWCLLRDSFLPKCPETLSLRSLNRVMWSRKMWSPPRCSCSLLTFVTLGQWPQLVEINKPGTHLFTLGDTWQARAAQCSSISTRRSEQVADPMLSVLSFRVIPPPLTCPSLPAALPPDLYQMPMLCFVNITSHQHFSKLP